jgi:hypothetical protein
MSGCGVFCNVVRVDACGTCGEWVSYCLTHQRPTPANRCACVPETGGTDAGK